jgi:hypothetical protein
VESWWRSGSTNCCWRRHDILIPIFWVHTAAGARPPAGVPVAEWQHEPELEEAQTIYLYCGFAAAGARHRRASLWRSGSTSWSWRRRGNRPSWMSPDLWLYCCRGPPPAGVSVAEWQHELELEEARQLSLALEASKRECAGLPSEDLIQVLQGVG